MEELAGTFLLGSQLLCESHQPKATQSHNLEEEEVSSQHDGQKLLAPEGTSLEMFPTYVYRRLGQLHTLYI